MDGQIQPIEDDGAQQAVTTNQTSTSMNDVQSGVSKDSREKSELAAIVDALNKSQATIEFDMDGKILHANDLFLGAMGYSLNEIKGKHHSMFVEPEYAASNEYRDFWLSLQAGKFQAVVDDPGRLAAQASHREPALTDTYTMVVAPVLNGLGTSI